LWYPNLQRTHDKIIMDEIELIDSSTTDKCVFNYWRIYFKVITISNIVNNKGSHIKKKYLDKKLLKQWKPESTLLWPNQQMPHEKYFNVWIKGLESIVKFNRTTGELYKKLGNWLADSTYEGDNEVMLHKNGQILAIKDIKTGKWHQHNISHKIMTKQFFEKISMDIATMIHEEYIPIDMIEEKKTKIKK
jgi:hypothetical protein